jgi:hypothetical protein
LSALSYPVIGFAHLRAVVLIASRNHGNLQRVACRRSRQSQSVVPGSMNHRIFSDPPWSHNQLFDEARTHRWLEECRAQGRLHSSQDNSGTVPPMDQAVIQTMEDNAARFFDD